MDEDTEGHEKQEGRPVTEERVNEDTEMHEEQEGRPATEKMVTVNEDTERNEKQEGRPATEKRVTVNEDTERNEKQEGRPATEKMVTDNENTEGHEKHQEGRPATEKKVTDNEETESREKQERRPAKEKKVTVNEDPDIYEINPDTTEVSPVERPRKQEVEVVVPIGPSLDLDKIVSETVDIVRQHQVHTDQQKHTLSMLAFMLSRVKESVELYSHHTEKLSNFFFNNDLLQSEWYYKYCEQLPAYGDYNKVLKDTEGLVQVDDLPTPVPESELRKIVDDVTNNFYAGGAHIKTQQTLCRHIEAELDGRRELCSSHIEKYQEWLTVFNVEVENQGTIEDALFEIMAYVDFLKGGDSSEPYTLAIGELGLDKPAPFDSSVDK